MVDDAESEQRQRRPMEGNEFAAVKAAADEAEMGRLKDFIELYRKVANLERAEQLRELDTYDHILDEHSRIMWSQRLSRVPVPLQPLESKIVRGRNFSNAKFDFSHKVSSFLTNVCNLSLCIYESMM